MKKYVTVLLAVLLALAAMAYAGRDGGTAPDDHGTVRDAGPGGRAKYDAAVVDPRDQTVTYYEDGEPVRTVPVVTGTAD